MVNRERKLHCICKVCGASRPRGMIRSILATIEMRVAGTLSNDDGMDQKPSYSLVCRDCWLKFVSKMSKRELVSVLEVVSCDLYEVYRLLCEKTGENLPEVSQGVAPLDDLPF